MALIVNLQQIAKQLSQVRDTGVSRIFATWHCLLYMKGNVYCSLTLEYTNCISFHIMDPRTACVAEILKSPVYGTELGISFLIWKVVSTYSGVYIATQTALASIYETYCIVLFTSVVQTSRAMRNGWYSTSIVLVKFWSTCVKLCCEMVGFSVTNSPL